MSGLRLETAGAKLILEDGGRVARQGPTPNTPALSPDHVQMWLLPANSNAAFRHCDLMPSIVNGGIATTR